MEFFSKLGSMIGKRLMGSYQNSAIPGVISTGQGLLGQLQQGPEMMGPVPQDQMAPLNPRDVNYQMPQRQQRDTSGIGMQAAQAPQLQNIGGGPVGGYGDQYQGGIPELLRSYGEPSVGLLKYIER